MITLIDEAEESIKKEGTITLEEWREELMREYNVVLWSNIIKRSPKR